MRLFGFDNFLRKAILQTLTSISSSSSWWMTGIRESFAGAWQKNITIDAQPNLLANSSVYACVTGIAADVAKLRIKLDQNNDGIWDELTTLDGPGKAWLPVLRKPNHYQTRIEFIEQWIVSKLLAGNAYILKERDQRGVVIHLYVLDPRRVVPLVADDGSVYYQLNPDYLSGVGESVTLPASEIIHDRMVCLWHPLVGVSPLYACGLSATMGSKIQQNSTNLFGNASRPGGVVTVPGHITNDQAEKLKQQVDSGFSGTNVGRTMILSDGMKFEAMTLTAEASQQVEQLGWTVEDVGRAFHYPKWKLTWEFPPYSSGPQALTLMYYTDCLQPLIEKMELCLDEGLEFPIEKNYGTELDLDNLLRMDTAALYESNNKSAGWMKINEMRFRANLPPTDGGDAPYLQQQNYSLSALAKRDAGADPFSKTAAAPSGDTPPALPPAKSSMDLEDIEFFEAELQKELVTSSCG